MIIGPGFSAPPVGTDIPPLCAGGSHSFSRSGVCETCRRTVPELARLGLARPVSCDESGIHVVIGKVCIECREQVEESA